MPRSDIWLVVTKAKVKGVQFSRFIFVEAASPAQAEMAAVDVQSKQALELNPRVEFLGLEVYDEDLNGTAVAIIEPYDTGLRDTEVSMYTNYTTLVAIDTPPELLILLDGIDEQVGFIQAAMEAALETKTAIAAYVRNMKGEEWTQDNTDEVVALLDTMQLEETIGGAATVGGKTTEIRALYPIALDNVVIQARGGSTGQPTGSRAVI